MLLPSPSSMRAAATTPAEPADARVARFPAGGSLPRQKGGSASALLVSGPAQRSLALQPAWSLSRPRRPRYIGVLQAMSLPPSPAPIATGWSDSCRAGFAPARRRRLSMAHQPTRARELGRHHPHPLGERGHATRPGNRRRWSGLDPRRTHPNGLALGALSARECPLHMVRRAHRGEPGTDPPCDDRCACPQATHRSLAVLGERSCTVRRQARLTQRPHCSSPAGRGRRWAGW